MPYGYASNISKLVNLMDDRFNEIKSHDCHMFIQHPFHLCAEINCKKRYEMHL
jgi:hypothetical protein